MFTYPFFDQFSVVWLIFLGLFYYFLAFFDSAVFINKIISKIYNFFLVLEFSFFLYILLLFKHFKNFTYLLMIFNLFTFSNIFLVHLDYYIKLLVDFANAFNIFRIGNSFTQNYIFYEHSLYISCISCIIA